MKKINFNKDWLFKFGENIGAECTREFEDFDLIGLPHSFGIPYYGDNDFYVGYGCYVKRFDISAESLARGGKVCLEFGAVFQVAQVYVNGALAGGHEGGYTAFLVDITPHLVAGENVVFVRVNNLWNPTIAPRAGEHTFNGGIYRDVYLIEYPESHIGWYGVGVCTQRVPIDGDNAIYDLNVSVESVRGEGKYLRLSVMDSDGACFASAECEVKGAESLLSVPALQPKQWDTSHPYLYTALVEMVDGAGEVVDSLSVQFGFRDIKWTKDNGFFLNGKRVALEGANVHQDHGGWGDAITQSGVARDVAIIKAGGFNFVRGSHYPHHTRFAQECDRQGVLFWSENVFWGIGGFGRDGYWDSSAMPTDPSQFADFERSLRTQLAEMVKQNRNSPSIICWSMGNEIFFSRDKVVEDAKKLVKRLVDYCHQLDSTRPAGVGGTQRGGFDLIGDVAGYNGDGAVLFKNPDVPNMVAEYGSIPSYRPGKYDLYETAGSDEYYDWRAGRCIWCGFHHGSIAGIGNLGICDLYRLPLRAYYCHRKHLLGIDPPKFAGKGKGVKLVLSADKTEIAGDGTDDCMVVCSVVDKNGVRVSGHYDITISVESGGLVLPTGESMTFSRANKNCFDGMCAIEMRGYYGGDSVIKATCYGLESALLSIHINAEEEYSGQKITYKPAKIDSICRERDRVNIIKDRPCTTSSEEVEGASICLTTASEHKYWSASEQDGEPWIILDLEHCYTDFAIEISKALFSKLLCDIYVSSDRQSWTRVAENNKGKASVDIECRYVKICPNKEAKIKKINIFA